jgi:hypothetical protein
MTPDAAAHAAFARHVTKSWHDFPPDTGLD